MAVDQHKLSTSTLLILSLVMVVNALSYGTILPLLYPYASHFGLDAAGLGWLFASFSLAQFVATPIIGRLSDRYGRKPLMLFCLFGTSLSLTLFALAQSVAMLFLARVLDGITGGNNSVAQAIITDQVSGKERAKAFGMIGAAYGFGFLFGPALGGMMSTISLTAPFWFAAGLALASSIAAGVFLPETLSFKNKTGQKNQPLFNIAKMWSSLFSPAVGLLFVITFLTAISQNAWIIGFQAQTVDGFALSARDIGLLYSMFGMISIVMQAVGMRLILDVVPHKRHILAVSLFLTALTIAATSLSDTFWPFLLFLILYAFSGAPVMPMLTALLTERTNEEDQGGVLGLNQSYMSLGQIVGPVVAGWLVVQSITSAFIVSSLVQIVALVACLGLYTAHQKKFDL